MTRWIALFSALAFLIVCTLAIPSAPARADTAAQALAALHWAENHEAGHWYCWGGAGPTCYDCSGAVMAAYARALGISLPHSTYSMLASGRLYRIRIRDARRGDLMFYGTGHVELKTRHGTFGALESGTRVGWHRPSGWWHPTMAYRVAIR
jgi:cell wall-associated NlpC family hydrolase